MAKKKKKNKEEKAVEAIEAPVVEEAPVAVEAPVVKKASAPKKSTKEFPPFTGGGYNDYLNWKSQKDTWEANNG